MPIFECRALEKRYGAAMALDHIDLALEPGRIVGLLGPNGSGKSTLIKLAMGLLQPTSGEVLIGGQAPSPQTNAVVSYLPDRITLSPWMKTRQCLISMATSLPILTAQPPNRCSRSSVWISTSPSVRCPRA